MSDNETLSGGNFIRDFIDEDLQSNKHSHIVTRFPPEPNGYLHIGHAKSICLNFGIARDYQGTCHLRFDDTNPVKEDTEYTESIQQDVRWLGFDWGDKLFYASDYFEQLYAWAVYLIEQGKAYVDNQSADEIRNNRGTLTQPGLASTHRERSVEENLDLFRRMRAGEFDEGSCVLRAKIDMAAANINLRDPALYRIRKVTHHRTGDTWCIYPTYDFAHGQSDAIEGITHSLCTLEFENHRPLYEWFVSNLPVPNQPRQIEFARLNLGYTVMSKRKLLTLVQDKHVDGWDDPRMPTICGLRRRGYTPESLRAFAERIGVAKRESWVDVTLLENAIRDDLNTKVMRAMCVLKPLKVVIENFAEGEVIELEAPRFPDDPSLMGSRMIPFSREIYIEREDFMEEPFKKYFRLAPGREVRLRWAFFLKCNSLVKDDNGDIIELRCTYDPETRGGNSPDGRKVKGTIHWVSAAHAVGVETRLYDRLFDCEKPGTEKDFLEELNTDSLQTITAMAEPSLANMQAGERAQFERQGYFYVDPIDSKPGAPVFNRIVTLKDSWAKLVKKGQV